MAGWSRSENERFERALATYDRDMPGRWDRVAAAVGGGKTADDVKRHYDKLVEDLRCIEAGHPNNDGMRTTNNENCYHVGSQTHQILPHNSWELECTVTPTELSVLKSSNAGQ